MDCQAFYAELFRPIEKAVGPIDPSTIVAIIGFDGGGPLNFSTVGAEDSVDFVTYVSCELAVRKEQVPSSQGRFELMCHCNDEDWVRRVLTAIGRMSLEALFDDGHTVDVSELAGYESSLRGLVLERYAAVVIDNTQYALLRVHGITSEELEFARSEGPEALLKRLKATGTYPNTDIRRRSVL